MLRRTLLVALVYIISGYAHSATLNTAGGQLIGASGVSVGGSFYDVEFVDGTCAASFNDCNQLSDFAFVTQTDADLASQALLDQVFLNTPLGSFDDDPELTAGCVFVQNCLIGTPYGFTQEANVLFFLAINYEFGGPTDTTSGPNILSPNSNSPLNNDLFVWARWTPQAPVIPVPAAAWLFGTALVGFVGYSRRRKIR